MTNRASGTLALTLLAVLILAMDASEHTVAAESYITPFVQNGKSTHFSSYTYANSASQTESDLLLTKAGGRFAFGTGIGDAGTISGDFNGDGNNVLWLSSWSNSSYNTYLSKLNVANGFEIEEQLLFSEKVGAIYHYRDIALDRDFALIGQTGELTILDLQLEQIVKSIDLPEAWRQVISIAEADLFQDGKTKILIQQEYGTLSIWDPNSWSLQGTYKLGEGQVLPGSFSEQNSTELVFSDGSIYRFEDGDFVLYGSFDTQLGYNIVATDINNNGLLEIIGSQHWYDISAYSAQSFEKLWEHESKHNIHALGLYDVNGDGQLDVVYGDGQWGSIHALQAKNGKRFWSIANDDNGVSFIHVEDLTGDGKTEVAWASDHLYVHDYSSSDSLFKSQRLTTPFTGYDLIQQEDGDFALLQGAYDSNVSFGTGTLSLRRLNDHYAYWDHYENSPYPSTWTGYRAVKVVDSNNDGKLEVLLGTSVIRDGRVHVMDSNDGSLLYSIELDYGEGISALEFGNPSDTSGQKILAGSLSGKIHQINPFSQSLEKSSPQVPTQYNSAIDDLTISSSIGERLVYALSDQQIFAYHTDTNSFTTFNHSRLFTSLLGDPAFEVPYLLAGSESGLIHHFDPESVTQLYPVCDSPVSGLSWQDVQTVLFTCEEEFGAFSIASNQVLWRQPVQGVEGPVKYRVFGSDEWYISGGLQIRVFQRIDGAPGSELVDISIQTHGSISIEESLAPDEISVDQYLLHTAPSHGTFEFTNRQKGEFRYTPSATSLGTEYLSFSAIKDGQTLTPASLVIDLYNQAPTAENQSVEVHWANTEMLEFIAADEDGDPLTYSILNQPELGSVEIPDSNVASFSYVPTGQAHVTDKFSFAVTDPFGESDTAVVTISLTNDAPISEDLHLKASVETEVHSRLLGQDPNDDAIVFEIIEGPEKGDLSIEAETGLFHYKPVGNEGYVASFQYQVRDAHDVSEVSTVTITLHDGVKIVEDKGSLGFWALGLLGLFATARRRLLH